MRHGSLLLSGALVSLTVLFGAACSNVVGGVNDPGDGGAPVAPPPTVENVDLVLVVDNSASMADKQQILSKSIHQLLDGLVNPPCLDADGHTQQPASPSEACAAGFERAFPPIQSVHLGIISSSLGGLGADQCIINATHQNNDRAHLISRGKGGGVPTYLNYGFLNFDPANVVGGEVDFDAFVASAVEMVQGVGQIGCGYEMPLEAAYRFLVDPAPYAEIEREDPNNPYAITHAVGLDTVLLEQRASFLRNDSLVGVVMLSDENDCSFKVGDQFYSIMNTPGFFKGAPICETDPGNECCMSCALEPPPFCTPDPACAGGPKYDVNAGEDSVNLRCFDQMRRYGIDALYPTARYVNAFTKKKIAIEHDDLLPVGDEPGIDNPLFAGGRDERLFVFSGIVGVPWQLIASDPSDPTAGAMTSEELVQSNRWAQILGEPELFVPAADPLMVESVAARPGVDASVNGGDRTTIKDDLQYACTFPLAEPTPGGPACGPVLNGGTSPICDGTTQIGAGAYPGLRELAVMRGLGDKAVVGSICEPSTTIPEEVEDPAASTFGYNRSLSATASRMTAIIRAGNEQQQ